MLFVLYFVNFIAKYLTAFFKVSKMELENIIAKLISTLKKSFGLLGQNDIKPIERMNINNFLNFVKIRVLSGNRKAKAVLSEFEKKPDDKKLEGKIEVWLEVELEKENDARKELLEKIEHINEIFEKREQKAKETSDKLNHQTAKKTEPQKASETSKDIQTEEKKLSEGEIIIAYDFNGISDIALEYSVKFAKLTNSFLTIVAKAHGGKERAIATKKIQKLISYAESKYKLKIKGLLKDDDLYKAAKEVAIGHNAKIIIAGINGNNDIDNFSDCLIPFIALNGEEKNQDSNLIIFPVDERKEIKKKLNLVKYLATYKEYRYCLALQEKYPNDAIKEKTEKNCRFIEDFLKKNHIVYQTQKAPKTDEPEEAALYFAEKNEVKLIMVLTEHDFSLHGVSIGKAAHKLIKNEMNVPVMCISTKNTTTGSAFGGGVLY